MPYKDRDDYNNRRRRWRLERRIEKLPVRLPLMRTIKVQFRPAQLAVLDELAGGRSRSALIRELVDEAILARRK